MGVLEEPKHRVHIDPLLFLFGTGVCAVYSVGPFRLASTVSGRTTTPTVRPVPAWSPAPSAR